MHTPCPTAHPVLYSFRRCPYAMRARLALWAAQHTVTHREVVLRDKPAHLLALSPKGTVPVLWLPATDQHPQGQVLEQSICIMRWALQQADPLQWQPRTEAAWRHTLALVAHNDGAFKQQLDRYKYPNRFGDPNGDAARAQAAPWLAQLDAQLTADNCLTGHAWGMADAALAPFVRQFAHVNPQWFAAQNWPTLAQWLTEFEASPAFAAIMQKHAPWVPGSDLAAQGPCKPHTGKP